MSDPITDQITEEIIDLHRFFVDWYLGRIPPTDAEFRFFEASLEGDFRIVTPSGDTLDRDAILKAVRDGYGKHSDFDIEIKNPKLLHREGEIITASYEEWQKSPEKETARISTAIFKILPSQKRPLWIHVHETWLN